MSEQYNILPLLTEFTNPHHTLLILDFLEQNNVYESKIIQESREKILSKTKLGEANASEEASFSDIIEKINNWGLLEDFDNVLASCQESREHLVQTYQAVPQDNKAMYMYAIYLYERGNYQDSAKLLEIYRLVTKRKENLSSAAWGRLASYIHAANWEKSFELIDELKAVIDNPTGDLTFRKQLHQRNWLITWSLFPCFRSDEGLERFLQLTAEEKYRQTVQNGCPWVIRYIVCAILAVKSSDITSLKDIQRLVFMEAYQYEDPLTHFVQNLLKNFEFEKAEESLQEVDALLKKDYFISEELHQRIITNAREMIWKYYLSVHSLCEISFFAEKLSLGKQEAEAWVTRVLTEINKEFTIEGETVRIDSQSESDHIMSLLSKKFST